MIRKYKKHLIASSMITLLPVIIGIVFWKYFPEKMVSHWNLQGEPDKISSKFMVLFSLPVILFLLQWIGIFVTAKDLKNKEQNKKVFLLVFWIIPVISLVSWSVMVTASLGFQPDLSRMIILVIPIMFIILGNYMPKCKQNHTIGIRVKWTLENEENWNKTHRFAGRLWFYGGSITFLFSLFVPLEKTPFLLIVIVGLGIIPSLYSYLYYRKQVKTGRIRKEDVRKNSVNKNIGITVFIFGTVVFLLFVLRGEFEIILDSHSFTAEAKFWEDITVMYEEIDEIEYLENKKSGTRTFGYGSLSVLMGECKNDEWGNYTAYLYLKTEPCILIRVNGKILVINEEDSVKTKELYQELIQRK